MKRFSDFAAETAPLGRVDFEAAHPNPFLLLDPRRGRLDAGSNWKPALPPVLLGGVCESDIEGLPSESGFFLVIALVKGRDQRYPGLITIGRGGECDVVLDSPAVSKLHALVRRDPAAGAYTIVDANSTNGTVLDGSYVGTSEAREMKSGSVIVLGGAFRCTFNLPVDLFEYMDILKRGGKL